MIDLDELNALKRHLHRLQHNQEIESDRICDAELEVLQLKEEIEILREVADKANELTNDALDYMGWQKCFDALKTALKTLKENE